jgi:hypothetical protein
VVWLMLAPPPAPPPLPPARLLRAPPDPRPIHPLHLTVARGADGNLVASTSSEVNPQPVSKRDRLFLFPTTELPRDLHVRLFAVDSRGQVQALSAETGPPLVWRLSADGGPPPILPLDLSRLKGDVRLRAYVAYHPFVLPRALIVQALETSGRAPLDPRPLPVPLPPGEAGATFGEVTLLVNRSADRDP